MTLPPLPEEFELNWFSKRNAFDIAVKDFIEDGGGGVSTPVTIIWTGSAWRLVGSAVNLSARPTTGPLILVGGAAANRPTWANQDGDIHFPTS